jgi:ferrous iron transport protein B
MGLTRSAVGRGAERDARTRREPGDLLAALAGNPNVGKSTVFNALTGMNQHTGNWPGKTVATAEGVCRVGSRRCLLEDIPGTYSLLARSAEEEVARDFVCFGGADAVAVVCDATCLERNLNLVLQILEVTPRVVVCVNLLDEAKRRGVAVNLGLLERRLGVPVCGVTARKPATLTRLTDALDDCVSGRFPLCPLQIAYPAAVEQAADLVARALEPLTAGKLSPRWAALRLLEGDEPLRRRMTAFLGADPLEDPAVQKRLPGMLADGALRDALASAPVRTAEAVASGAVSRDGGASAGRDRKLDGILTGPWAYPVMLAALAGIFYLTVAGANVPSAYLADFLFRGEGALRGLLAQFGAPEWLRGLLADGAYRVLAWVVSVMLPPMAIFFPLFTLLEDAGYLPRVAFNLDCPFRRCGACGKQALTMAMGSAATPREWWAAGSSTPPGASAGGAHQQFCALQRPFSGPHIRHGAMFFVASRGGAAAGAVSALALTGVIRWASPPPLAPPGCSRHVLRGVPSSFTLELPPYRGPRSGR